MNDHAPDLPPVDLRGITIRYGEKTAVESVSLSVDSGDVYALLGRNGTGKSSIVRCLLGMQRPAAGTVRLLGLETWEHRAAAMLRVGVVPEEPDASVSLTPDQILDFCRPLYRSWNDAAASERLYRFQIDRNKPFGRLSKGQKSQVMLSLALAHEPEVLILDDPTLGLDAVARRELFEEIIVDLADHGTTVFITTHDLAGIEPMANRIGILHETKLIVDESLDSLKSRFRRLRVDRVDPSFENLVDALGPVSVSRFGPGAEAIVSGYGDETDPMRTSTIIPMSLEDIFVALTENPRRTES